MNGSTDWKNLVFLLYLSFLPTVSIAACVEPVDITSLSSQIEKAVNQKYLIKGFELASYFKFASQIPRHMPVEEYRAQSIRGRIIISDQHILILRDDAITYKIPLPIPRHKSKPLLTPTVRLSSHTGNPPVVAIAQHKTVLIIHVLTGEVLHTLHSSDPIVSLKIDPAHLMFGTAQDVQVYKVEFNKAQKLTLSPLADFEELPNGKIFLTGKYIDTLEGGFLGSFRLHPEDPTEAWKGPQMASIRQMNVKYGPVIFTGGGDTLHSFGFKPDGDKIPLPTTTFSGHLADAFIMDYPAQTPLGGHLLVVRTEKPGAQHSKLHTIDVQRFPIAAQKNIPYRQLSINRIPPVSTHPHMFQIDYQPVRSELFGSESKLILITNIDFTSGVLIDVKTGILKPLSSPEAIQKLLKIWPN
jgi:hypothetical protein